MSEEEQYECKICRETVTQERVITLECDHMFCDVCITKYLFGKIDDGEHQIICPYYYCGHEISYNIIKELTPDDMFDKYERILLRHSVLSSHDMSYCPQCDNVCVKYDNSNKTKCDNCYHKYCYACKKQWEKHHECNFEDLEDIINEVKYILDEHDVKYCPKCKIIMCRVEGCMAMKCKNCKTRFCWNCLRTNNNINDHGHECDNYRFDDAESDSEYDKSE